MQLSYVKKNAYFILHFQIIFYIFVFSTSAYSYNDLFSTLYNQAFTFNTLCLGDSESELKDYINCTKNPIRQSLNFTLHSQEILESLVFTDAAQIQWQKNKCMIEKLIVLNANPLYVKSYTELVVQAALRTRKAELFLKVCKRNRQIQSHNNQIGLKTEFKIKEEITDAKMKQICSDNKSISILQAAKDLYLRTLPTLQSSDLFDPVSANREAIKMKSTGKPITDEDIFTNDLSSFDFISIDKQEQSAKGKRLHEGIKNIVSNQLKQRIAIQSELKPWVTYGAKHKPSDGLKKLLVEEGSLLQAMSNGELIKLNPQTDTPVISQSGQCLLSKYIKAPAGLSVSLLIAAFYLMQTKNPLLARQLISKSSQSTAPIEQLSGMTLGKMGGYSLLSQQYVNHLNTACSQINLMDRLTPLSENIEDLKEIKLQIDKIFGEYKRNALFFDAKSAPSCYSDQEENFEVMKPAKFSDSALENCFAYTMLYLILPMKYALPLSGVLHEEEK